MINKTKLCFIVAILATVGLSGCASYNLNARQYGTHEVMRSEHTVPATVVAVRQVSIVNRHNRLGAAIGAVAGGFAGHDVGAGTGKTLASIAGAVAGAFGGSEAEKHITGRKKAYQITVRGPSGSDHTIVQPADGTRYTRGQKVLVIQQGGYNGRTRVEPES